MESTEKRRLLDAYFDDELSNGELALFEQMLSENLDLLKELVSESYFHMRLRMKTTAFLEGEFTSENLDDIVLLDQLEKGLPLSSVFDDRNKGEDQGDASKTSGLFGFLRNLPGYFSHNGFQIFVLLMLLLPSLFGFLFFMSNSKTIATDPLVTQTSLAKWGDGVSAIRPGDELTKGRAYTLEAGLVEVLFPNDARVIVHGPATFAVNANDLVQLDRGRCVAHVPPSAVGFTVDANGTRVVDLGTEFGVETNTDGETEVYVFKGKVELSLKDTPQAAKIELTENQGVCSSAPKGIVHTAKIDTDRFVRAFIGRSSLFSIANASFEQPGLADQGQVDGALLPCEIPYWQTNSPDSVGYCLQNAAGTIPGITQGKQAAFLRLSDGTAANTTNCKDVWMYYSFGKIQPSDVGHSLKLSIDCFAEMSNKAKHGKITAAFSMGTTAEEVGDFVGVKGEATGGTAFLKQGTTEAWVTITEEMVGQELSTVIQVEDALPGPGDTYYFDNVRLSHF